jgi:hypothetical protein
MFDYDYSHDRVLRGRIAERGLWPQPDGRRCTKERNPPRRSEDDLEFVWD